MEPVTSSIFASHLQPIPWSQGETGRPPTGRQFNLDGIRRIDALLQDPSHPVVLRFDPYESAGIDLLEATLRRFVVEGRIVLDPADVARLSVSERRAFQEAVLAVSAAQDAYDAAGAVRQKVRIASRCAHPPIG